MKIEVLMFGHVAEAVESELKGLKTFEESHNRISFICTESRFTKIYNAVRDNNFNPFAAMAWNQLTKQPK